MADLKNILVDLANTQKSLLGNTELPSFDFTPLAYQIKPQIPKYEIDPESTFAYQMQQQTDQIIEKTDEQIRLLNQQNEQLVSNYQKLEDLYRIKEKELEDAQKDTKKAKRYNAVMLILTIISMLIAIAAWLLPNLLGGVS